MQDVVCSTTVKTTSYIPPLSLPVLVQVRCLIPKFGTDRQLQIYPDVEVPTKYGLVYEDLALRTEDGVTLRSYLLMQRKEISHTHALHVDWRENQSNEDVCLLNLAFKLVTLIAQSGIVCRNPTYRHNVPWQRG